GPRGGPEKDADQAALARAPRYTSLAAVKTDASIYTGGELAAAIYFTTPLSLPYVLDNLVPKLAEVV
ncbi:MAG: ABC transporter substrate-binding protein, partial [Nakamurella sp.]